EFGTTIGGGFEIQIGGPRSENGQLALRDRRADSFDRNPNIVVREGVREGVVTALDPATGLPILVRHIDSNAAPGGNGTFEHPFQTLQDTEDRSLVGDILYAHAGSVFTPDVTFNLKPNQR